MVLEGSYGMPGIEPGSTTGRNMPSLLSWYPKSLPEVQSLSMATTAASAVLGKGMKHIARQSQGSLFSLLSIYSCRFIIFCYFFSFLSMQKADNILAPLSYSALSSEEAYLHPKFHLLLPNLCQMVVSLILSPIKS